MSRRTLVTLGAAAQANPAKRLAGAEVIVLEPQVAQPTRLKPPRLRFDRVVLSLLRRLRTALKDAIPTGTTVVVTVTAPIRLAARTAEELEEKIRVLLKKRAAKCAGVVNGNEVGVRIMKGSTAGLVGFVHNRDSDPDILLALTQLLLKRVKSSRPSIIAIADDPAWTKTYSRVCEQLFVAGAVVAVVGSNGEVLECK